MHKTYKGKYVIRNPDKYVGDPDDVIYRSLWEKSAFKWCEDSPRVKRWNSEQVIIPYMCEADRKVCRYHLDLCVEFADGRIVLVEIKPANQTKQPKKRSRTTKKYLKEVAVYAKNQSKWKAAAAFAKKNGVEFEIWTEHQLKALGIKIIART